MCTLESTTPHTFLPSPIPHRPPPHPTLHILHYILTSADVRPYSCCMPHVTSALHKTIHV